MGIRRKRERERERGGRRDEKGGEREKERESGVEYSRNLLLYSDNNLLCVCVKRGEYNGLAVIKVNTIK